MTTGVSPACVGGAQTTSFRVRANCSVVSRRATEPQTVEPRVERLSLSFSATSRTGVKSSRAASRRMENEGRREWMMTTRTCGQRRARLARQRRVAKCELPDPLAASAVPANCRLIRLARAGGRARRAHCRLQCAALACIAFRFSRSCFILDSLGWLAASRR